MKYMLQITTVAMAICLIAPVTAAEEDLFDPPGLLLTWQEDPLTTMTIDWNTEEEREALVQYRKHGEDGDWLEESGESFPFPFSERTVYRVELTDLEPGTKYDFRLGEDSREFRFRTMPLDASKPIRVAFGGDTRHQQDWMENTNRQARDLDADFVVWGGDLAYADGREDRLYRWEEWFDANKNALITETGRVIPIVAGIGNHEIVGGYYTSHEDYEQTDEWREEIAPYYYALFAFPGQPGYGALDFGDYMSIILLDTNHSNPVEGEQTEWLEQALAERADVPHVFPVYHVPAYPGHRDFDGTVSSLVREHWVPLFEEHGIQVAFENHDHVYKRTYPILGGEVNERGIVYIGDGAWGVSTRSGHDSSETWYLTRMESVRHLILGVIQGRSQSFYMIDEEGNLFDTYPEMTGITY